MTILIIFLTVLMAGLYCVEFMQRKILKRMFRKTFIACLLFCAACKKDAPLEPELPYDIFLIAGQSNTHLGYGLDTLLDKADPRIKQVGRLGDHNLRVIAAQEPLEHWTAVANSIGFGLSFAKEYFKKYQKEGRRVLLIPCGRGSTGLSAGHWNKGNELYNDAVDRTRYALSLNKENKLVAILWHQGESDIGWPGYQAALDSMIVNMRRDITGGQDVIFLLGGMVPYWVEQDNNRKALQSIIANTPQRISNTAFVNPYFPFVLKKQDSTVVPMHYDAACQRVLGMRYFTMYDSLFVYR